MFIKKNWQKWEHITFVEEFTAGIQTYELLRRVCLETGDIEWKRIKVKNCVHSLSNTLNRLSLTPASQDKE